MVCTVISILISRIYCITIYTKFLLYWFVRCRGEMLGYQKVLPKGVLQTDVVLLHGLACSDMDLLSFFGCSRRGSVGCKD